VYAYVVTASSGKILSVHASEQGALDKARELAGETPFTGVTQEGVWYIHGQTDTYYVERHALHE
jgi:hypothetical protein